MPTLAEPWNQIQAAGSTALSQSLRRLIRTGAVSRGDPLPSERMLAEGLSLSRTTVRAALADLERDGLLHVGHKRVRRIATAGEGPVLEHAVAVLGDLPPIDPTRAPRQPGWPSHIQTAATSRLQHDGWQSLSTIVSPNVPRAMQRVMALRPAGVVVAFDCSEPHPGEKLLPILEESGIPFIVHCDVAHDLPQFDRVCTDHAMGGRLLGEHIASLGCRNVIRIYRSPNQAPWLVARDGALCAALEQAGLKAPMAVRTPRFANIDDLGYAGNFEMFSRLFLSYLYETFEQQPDIDAIVTLTDRHAYEVGHACEMLGRKPGRDVMIFGYDNAWAEAPEREYMDNPVAATVDKHYPRIGTEMVKLLMQRLDGALPNEPQRRVVEPSLVMPGEATRAFGAE